MHQPRKRFGQNFLQDESVVRQLIAAIEPQQGQKFLEIGPGRGALTVPLLQRRVHLDAIEIDRDLAEKLRREHSSENLIIHVGDALEFDLDKLGPGLRIVGNLPYNVSTPLLFHFSNYAGCVTDTHFMLQREVVQRMCARAGSAAYGRLSVMMQYRWNIDSLFDVPPEAFHPAPKVWSSVVRMVPHRSLPHIASNQGIFAEIVMRAFGQRRKTLRNTLREKLGMSDFEQLRIDPAARGETLAVADFVRIANYIDAACN